APGCVPRFAHRVAALRRSLGGSYRRGIDADDGRRRSIRFRRLPREPGLNRFGRIAAPAIALVDSKQLIVFQQALTVGSNDAGAELGCKGEVHCGILSRSEVSMSISLSARR